jgi:hypothetical protein
MLVNVKVISHNGLELTHRKTHLLGSNQEAKVAIFEKCDMQTSWGAPQSGMKSKTHRRFRKPKRIATESSKQMQSTDEQST